MIKKLTIGTPTTIALLLLTLSGCSSQQSPAGVRDANDLSGRNGVTLSPATTYAIHQSSPDQLNSEELATGPHEGLLAVRRLYFGFNSYCINTKDLPVLQAHADYLKSHPSAELLIEGNTDARGSRNYNLALGQRRAEAVAKQLRTYGALPAQVHTISYGKERPVALGNNADAYAKNRRADIVYVSHY
jgi:peptidoglycan-associated lipoprotein